KYLRPVGRLAIKVGAWAEAAELWARLYAGAPDDREAPLQLARAYAATQQFDAAAEAAATVLARDPRHAEASRIRADVLLALGVIDEAAVAAPALGVAG